MNKERVEKQPQHERDAFAKLKFEWTIENFDVLLDYESPPIRLCQIVYFLLEHRRKDDGSLSVCLSMRSDCRMFVSGRVTVNDEAEFPLSSERVETGESTCLVRDLSLENVPKVKFILDLKLKTQEVVQSRVTKVDADQCMDNFVEAVRDLFKNSLFSDFRICGSHYYDISAHKNILSARSPFFARMFDDPSSENIHKTWIDFEILDAVIGFMYGHIPDLMKMNVIPQLRNLYDASNKYEVLDLRLLVAQTLVARVPDGWIDELGNMFNHWGDKDGITLVVEYCCMHYDRLIATDAFKKMNPKVMARITEIMSGK